MPPKKNAPSPKTTLPAGTSRASSPDATEKTLPVPRRDHDKRYREVHKEQLRDRKRRYRKGLEEGDREELRERNRLAAIESRQRRKEKEEENHLLIDHLRQEVQRLQRALEDNGYQKLEAQHQQLQQEVLNLRIISAERDYQVQTLAQTVIQVCKERDLAYLEGHLAAQEVSMENTSSTGASIQTPQNDEAAQLWADLMAAPASNETTDQFMMLDDYRPEIEESNPSTPNSNRTEEQQPATTKQARFNPMWVQFAEGKELERPQKTHGELLDEFLQKATKPSI